jgi:mannose-1-phosphate guanylyltransferase
MTKPKAGPLKLAEQKICADNPDNLFFVLNADIICDFPFEKMMQLHKWHSADATMLLTTVEDPSKYGVVVTNEEGRALQFVEKPSEFISNKINAGIYLLNTSLLKKIKLKPTSLEREIFPQVAREGQLYTLDLNGFWMDIGQPKDYLTGLTLYLEHLKEHNSDKLSTGPNIMGNVIIHPTAKVNDKSIIGPNVCIGENCVIEEGTR